jgi:hypothetical protein
MPNWMLQHPRKLLKLLGNVPMKQSVKFFPITLLLLLLKPIMYRLWECK